MTKPNKETHQEKVTAFIQSVNTGQTTDSYTIFKKSLEVATIDGKFDDRLFKKILKSALLGNNCSTLDLTTNPNFNKIIEAENQLDAKIENLSKSMKNTQISALRYISHILCTATIIAVSAYKLSLPPYNPPTSLVAMTSDMLGIQFSDARHLLAQADKYALISLIIYGCILGYETIKSIGKVIQPQPHHMKKFDEVIEAAHQLSKTMPENTELSQRIEDIKEQGNTQKTFKKFQQDQKMIKQATQKTESNVRPPVAPHDGTHHVVNITSSHSHSDRVTQRRAASNQRTITI